MFTIWLPIYTRIMQIDVASYVFIIFLSILSGSAQLYP